MLGSVSKECVLLTILKILHVTLVQKIPRETRRSIPNQSSKINEFLFFSCAKEISTFVPCNRARNGNVYTRQRILSVEEIWRGDREELRELEAVLTGKNSKSSNILKFFGLAALLLVTIHRVRLMSLKTLSK